MDFSKKEETKEYTGTGVGTIYLVNSFGKNKFPNFPSPNIFSSMTVHQVPFNLCFSEHKHDLDDIWIDLSHNEA